MSTTPPSELPWTGERYVPQLRGLIALEHLHRYAYAMEYVEGLRVLDLACGEGYGTDMISRVAREVTGVDIDPGVVAHAQQKYGSDRVRFHTGTCTQVPLEDQSVDAVVSFETIEHLEDHDSMMQEIRRVLTPEGLLIISSPDITEYRNDAEPNPYHLKELRPDEFHALLKRFFQTVHMFQQGFISGSSIQNRDAPLPVAWTYDFAPLPGAVERTPGPPAGIYLIAIASNRDHLPVSASFCKQPPDQTFFGMNIQEKLQGANQTIRKLEEQLLARQEKLDQIQNHSGKRIGNLEQELEAAQAELQKINQSRSRRWAASVRSLLERFK